MTKHKRERKKSQEASSVRLSPEGERARLSPEGERSEEKKIPLVNEHTPLHKYDHDLWNNPMVESARRNMTPEQLAEYARIGEEIHQTDFTNPNLEKDFLEEPTRYISLALSSGIHPSFLSDNEKEIMRQTNGDQWFREWGYTEEDLNNI